MMNLCFFKVRCVYVLYVQYCSRNSAHELLVFVERLAELRLRLSPSLNIKTATSNQIHITSRHITYITFVLKGEILRNCLESSTSFQK